MKRRNLKFNVKRKLGECKEVPPEDLEKMAERIKYGGNPEHKRNPGDFGLTPPSGARPAKSLCDEAKIFTKEEALRLLQEGCRRGLISQRKENGWPKNIWSVKDDMFPLEAQLESSVSGSYHGYPMPKEDPFREEVLKRWREQDHDD